jgi:hypothetical protein
MKNDPMTTLLNFVLALLVIAAVGCAYLAIKRTGEQRNLSPITMQVNSKVMMVQSLISDVYNYNQQEKNPDIAKMLQPLMPRQAASK